MKKIYLAVLFYLITVLPARADREGEYVRIECNRDFGLLDIERVSVRGAKIGSFFYQEFLTYEYDVNKNGKSDVDMLVLNGYELQEPYTYHCELAPNQKFDITISGRGYYTNDVSFYVDIVEHQTDLETKEESSKVLLDKVIIGAGGKSSRIFIAARDDNLGTDITFEQGHFVAYFMEAEDENGITEQAVEDEIQAMKEYVETHYGKENKEE